MLGRKFFISWSGDSARELAEALKGFLEDVFLGEEAFFSPRDIEAGRIGISALFSNLRSAEFAFVLLTPKSIHSSWVSFEAGFMCAAAIGENTKVFPVLCGITQQEVQKHPLGQIQCRSFSRNDLLDMVKVVNDRRLLNKLSEDRLLKQFERAWVDADMDTYVDRCAEFMKTSQDDLIYDGIAMGFDGQGELATMNIKDVIEIVEDVLQKKSKGRGGIDGGHF